MFNRAAFVKLLAQMRSAVLCVSGSACVCTYGCVGVGVYVGVCCFQFGCTCVDALVRGNTHDVFASGGGPSVDVLLCVVRNM